jgi:PilZ domain
MARGRAGPGERDGDDAAAEVERRTAARLDKVFPVFIEGDRGGAMGVARNISDGGMFVETRNPEPIGAQIRITFPSGSGEMTAVAEVRYVCHLLGLAEGVSRRAAIRGMGVRFLYFEAAGAAPPILH